MHSTNIEKRKSSGRHKPANAFFAVFHFLASNARYFTWSSSRAHHKSSLKYSAHFTRSANIFNICHTFRVIFTNNVNNIYRCQSTGSKRTTLARKPEQEKNYHGTIVVAHTHTHTRRWLCDANSLIFVSSSRFPLDVLVAVFTGIATQSQTVNHITWHAAVDILTHSLANCNLVPFPLKQTTTTIIIFPHFSLSVWHTTEMYLFRLHLILSISGKNTFRCVTIACSNWIWAASLLKCHRHIAETMEWYEPRMNGFNTLCTDKDWRNIRGSERRVRETKNGKSISR